MTKFISRDTTNDSVFILGSYHPDNLSFLINLRDYLISNGISNTYLAFDKYIKSNSVDRSKNQQSYEKVEKLLEESTYCIFILFNKHNESVMIELTTFLKSTYYLKNQGKNILLLPSELEIYSMLSGLTDQQEIKIFRYFDISEINSYCLRFIKYQ